MQPSPLPKFESKGGRGNILKQVYVERNVKRNQHIKSIPRKFGKPTSKEDLKSKLGFEITTRNAQAIENPYVLS